MEEKISVVVMHFKSMPDFVVTSEYYKECGGFMKFCRENSIKPSNVSKVMHDVIDAKDFPTKPWEG